MPDFYCKNCDVHQEFPNLDTALEQFDHAIAIRKGRMCPNNNLEDYHWDGMVVALIKHPERYPTNPDPKLVPRKDNSTNVRADIIKGDSVIEHPKAGNELDESPKEMKLKSKKPKTETK